MEAFDVESLPMPSSPTLSDTDMSPLIPSADLPEIESPLPTASLVNKMERFASRLRENPNWTPPADYCTVEQLTTIFDTLLSASDHLNVLPAKQKVAPNRCTANETRETMPRLKNKRKSALDSQAYGGGQNSGAKAKSKLKSVGKNKALK